jgi:hypothetical protein
MHPLAYVTGSWPRGSIRAPPERGAEAYTIWSRHVSAPGPCLALIKVQVLLLLESWDPVVSGLDPPPPRGVRDPSQGSSFVPVEVLDLARRSDLCIQGSGTSLWRSGPTVDTLEYIVSSSHVAPPEPPTWWGRALFAT